MCKYRVEDRFSIVSVPGDPPVIAHKCAFFRVNGPVDALSYKQLPDFIIEKHHYRVGDRWNHEVRDCNRASWDRDLHEWHVNQEQAEQKLKQKWDVSPKVVYSMLCEGKISSSTNNIVCNLKQYGCYEICSLSIKKSLRSITDLLASLRRDSVESRYWIVAWIPSALTIAVPI